MREVNRINPSDFVQMFGDGSVKALLNWRRVNDSLFQVKESFSHSLDYLGNLSTVWYVDGEGHQTDCYFDGARPMTVHQAAQARDSWQPERQIRIAEFEKTFAAHREYVQLILPGYEIVSKTLILDGTHRSVAAYRLRMPVRLFVFSLRGPVNEELLPDLRHYL